MANWKEYTTKTIPEDTDEIVIADAKANANKRTPLSGLWNWIAGKLATAVISQLETQNKSIIPALNELNSKSFSLAANSNNTLTPSDDLNADFETFAPRTISIRRFSNGVPGQPGERGNGVLFTYKDAANYGWSIVIINGNIYTRKITDGNIGDWKSIATK